MKYKTNILKCKWSKGYDFGSFFCGFHQKCLEPLLQIEITACATTEIIDEYRDIDTITAKEFCQRYNL